MSTNQKTKNILIILLALIMSACTKEKIETVVPDIVKDHEGNEYKIKEYGTQIWMVENMKAKTTKNGQQILKYPANGQFSYDEPMAYYIRNDKNLSTNGRGYLYNFAAAQEICPDGWRLPSTEDFNTLKNYIEQEYTSEYNDDIITVAKAMADKYNWQSCDTLVGAPGYHCATNNTSQFSMKPVGGYYTVMGTEEDPDFYNYGWKAQLWTSTPYNNEVSYYLELKSYSNTADFNTLTIFQAIPVRCVKDK